MRTPLPPLLVDVLRKPNPCIIATARPDGRPVSSAVWYLWEDGEVLTTMSARSPRVQNLRAEPRASLTVLDGPDWYRQVTLHGTVVSLEEDGDLEVLDRSSRHYDGRPYPDRDPAHRHVVARIRIDSWDQFGFPVP